MRRAHSPREGRADERAGSRLTKDDQSGPDRISPTGAADGDRRQQGETLTTAQGARLTDTDHSLKAGPRGPILLQDHHFREKITHFDHERIPERVVHARGAAAHGVFRANGAAENITSAAFLRKDVETPVFVRFSTVLGSRGSADTVRDTRGFATKFYTEDGTFDLVGNNIPVFFIQDAIKFRTSSMPVNRTRTGRFPRRRVRTTHSGISSPSTLRPPHTRCGTCRIVEFHVRTG